MGHDATGAGVVAKPAQDAGNIALCKGRAAR
jgi:hypothetical protein